MYTTEIGAFTQELIAERVRQQVAGITAQNFAQSTGLGRTSVIPGATIAVEVQSIAFNRIEGRGSRGLQIRQTFTPPST